MIATLTTAKSRKATKTVHIVARVTFKAEERKAYTCYIVRSSNGVDTYTVTLVNGTATGCDCPARKPCYHMTGCESAEQKIVAQKAQRAEELAVAAQVAPLVLGEFASDLQAHLEDEMPALPVVVRTLEKLNVYVLTPDDKYECVRAADLDYFYPQHRDASDDEIVYLNSETGPLRQGRQVVRASYRDMYAADFNSIAS